VAPFSPPVFAAVPAPLRSFGPLTVCFLTAGIFFKRARTFAELRPMRKHARLSVLLSRVVVSPRFARTWRGRGLRSAYFIDLRTPADVDAEMRDWLTEAYFASAEETRAATPRRWGVGAFLAWRWAFRPKSGRPRAGPGCVRAGRYSARAPCCRGRSSARRTARRSRRRRRVGSRRCGPSASGPARAGRR